MSVSLFNGLLQGIKALIDINKDGRINLDDLTTAGHAVKKLFDLNNDGQINLDDLTTAGHGVKKLFDLNNDGQINLDDLTTAGHGVIKHFDFNGDGKLDFDDVSGWLNNNKIAISIFDRNHDGKIDWKDFSATPQSNSSATPQSIVVATSDGDYLTEPFDRKEISKHKFPKINFSEIPKDNAWSELDPTMKRQVSKTVVGAVSGLFIGVVGTVKLGIKFANGCIQELSKQDIRDSKDRVVMTHIANIEKPFFQIGDKVTVKGAEGHLFIVIGIQGEAVCLRIIY